MPTKRFSTRSSRPMPLALPQGVEPGQQRSGRQFLAVDRDRIALLEPDLDIGRLVGRVLRARWCADRRIPPARARDPRAPCPRWRSAGGWRRPRTALRRACPRAIGIWFFSANSISLVRLVSSHSRQGAITLMSGLQRVVGQLEAHLVVALAGRAMGDGVGAGLLRDLDLALGDQRPRDRGAEQIGALIERVGAEHREHVVAHERLAQVLDDRSS